jgi:hypothetical protein
MKSSDLPILQFFTRKSPEKAHDIIEDIDDDDDEDEDENEEYLSIENSHNEDCCTKLIDEDSNMNTTICPVCQKMLLGDNDKINKHIDLCLNGQMILTTIKEEDQRTSPQSNSNKRYFIKYILINIII